MSAATVARAPPGLASPALQIYARLICDAVCAAARHREPIPTVAEMGVLRLRSRLLPADSTTATAIIRTDLRAYPSLHPIGA
jgi:hypothetical protein